MQINLPKLSLVVLVGPSGAGKSTFARKHFLPTEILSSDYCRGLVSDDENNQAATNDAFDVLHYVAAKRLARGRLTVVDATNVQADARKPLIQLARKYHCLPMAIVLNPPENICVQRNETRPDRDFGSRVVRMQRVQLRQSLRGLKREGFRQVVVLNSVDDIETVEIKRVPLWTDRSDEHGPLDFVGDVHGCCDELEQLLIQLGYEPFTLEDESPSLWGSTSYRHPQGRKLVFVGDLVDRGPRVLDVLRIARNMVRSGDALCVPGNHDVKLLRKLRGANVQLTHGLAQSVAEIDALPEEGRESFLAELCEFLDGLVSHYVFDNGQLVVAHAGMKEEMQGRGSGAVREFALYGETTGETDEFGLPVRYNWAADYRGSAQVVYGHTPVPEPEWLNRTVCIDTGCVFGGKLTAMRYPEREFVSVQALKIYCEPSRPFLPAAGVSGEDRTAQHQLDDVLDAADVLGKRIISTRLQRNVIIQEENATAALEVMSRYAANPKWLIYLPPTMSPCETSSQPGMLEHPEEAFAYYRQQGASEVICQEKHMGSRAVVVVCRDEQAARERFGIAGSHDDAQGEVGIIYTRTGRRFFNDPQLERALLDRLRGALTAAGFWDKFETPWACFDCELMPWSAKAQELLRTQYAAVGSAGRGSLPQAVAALAATQQRLLGESRERTEEVLQRVQARSQNIDRFVNAYRQYCWNVQSLDDFKLAPFHLLASEGSVHADQDHRWHMETLADICSHDPQMLLATEYRLIDVTDAASVSKGTAWWQALTERGGEGMVIKPRQWIVRGSKGLVQPAIKCRGKEYLRIIYSPDYDSAENLPRLRKRALGRKRSLALREFSLGLEALERFVQREPLRRVHECVFGVLALESEPIDPRL